MTRKMTLTPAYGRDYKSKREVVEHINDDLDFIIADVNSRYCGKPINHSQLRDAGIEAVNVRYSGLKKVVVVDVSTVIAKLGA